MYKMIYKTNLGIIGIIILFLVFISSCKEDPPNVDLTMPDETLIDTTYEYIDTIILPQDKNVLIEDMTGSSCPNCPDAHEKVDSIMHEFPQRVYAISNFYKNLSQQTPDLYNSDGQDLFDFISPKDISFPMIGVDRKEYDGFIFSGNHISIIGLIVPERLSLVSKLNIEFNQRVYDSQNREVQFIIKISFLEAVETNRFLSLAVIEDSIESFQSFNILHPLYPDIEDYMQRYVLRDLVTPYTGVQLNADLIAGRIFEKEFKYSIDQNWDEKKCYLVAFVHQVADSFDIDQVNQIPVIDN